MTKIEDIVDASFANRIQCEQFKKNWFQWNSGLLDLFINLYAKLIDQTSLYLKIVETTSPLQEVVLLREMKKQRLCSFGNEPLHVINLSVLKDLYVKGIIYHFYSNLSLEKSHVVSNKLRARLDELIEGMENHTATNTETLDFMIKLPCSLDDKRRKRDYDKMKNHINEMNKRFKNGSDGNDSPVTLKTTPLLKQMLDSENNSKNGTFIGDESSQRYIQKLTHIDNVPININSGDLSSRVYYEHRGNEFMPQYSNNRNRNVDLTNMGVFVISLLYVIADHSAYHYFVYMSQNKYKNYDHDRMIQVPVRRLYVHNILTKHRDEIIDEYIFSSNKTINVSSSKLSGKQSLRNILFAKERCKDRWLKCVQFKKNNIDDTEDDSEPSEYSSEEDDNDNSQQDNNKALVLSSDALIPGNQIY